MKRGPGSGGGGRPDGHAGLVVGDLRSPRRRLSGAVVLLTLPAARSRAGTAVDSGFKTVLLSPQSVMSPSASQMRPRGPE